MGAPLLAILFVRAALALGDGSCAAWADPVATGSLGDPDLVEASGLVASQITPGILWSHNDSGGDATVYAMDTDGTLVGAFAVPGADNTDWEDLASGPCSDTDCACLYAADIGDSSQTRDEVLLYRFPEPDLDAGQTDRAGKAEEIWFKYPDGASWNAEALVVDPATSEVFVITKVDGLAGVFAFPDAPVPSASKGSPITLQKIANLDLKSDGASDLRVTGASASPGGRRVVVRTDTDLFLYTAPDGGTLRDAFATTPERLDAPTTPHGEGVAWAPDSQSLYLVEEGVGSTIWQISCSAFTPSTDGLPDALPACPVPKGCACSEAGSVRVLGGVLVALIALIMRSFTGRRARPAPPPPDPR